ncbi:hypothetical protein LTR74_006698 [Friedmanniomyces endolithicus]|nr:hypothetical protein LTR74_006698 [Friedmanniomyces endolithicus]
MLAASFIVCAIADPSSWIEQAAKAVKGELDKVDLDGASAALHSAGEVFSVWTQQAVVDTKSQIENIDLSQAAKGLEQSDGFEGWLKQATKDVGLHTALEDLQYVNLEELPEKTARYIRENPGQTAFYVANGVVIIAPVVVTGPLYAVFGFGANGVRAASLAAKAQSLYGAAVPAGGVFAHLTSAAMGGYGVPVVNGVVQAGAAAGMAVKKVVDYAGGAGSDRFEL